MCLEGCALLEVLTILTDIEAGAGLVGAGELRVAYDVGLRVILVELLQEFEQGVLLQLGTRVGVCAMFVKASFVTDCYRAVVIAHGMYTLYTFGQNGNDVAIALYVIVIRGLAESLLAGVDEAIDSEGMVASTA